MKLQAETDFFHYIATKAKELVLSYEGKATVAKYKDKAGDYATEIDIAVENLIVSEIQKRFPGDAIMAEEGHPDTTISSGRIWIIDPICGTTNLGRGLKVFCTNIALADNMELIASCVVDHSQDTYFWSTGDNEVYINKSLLKKGQNEDKFGVVVDLDFGALGNVDEEVKKKHSTIALKVSLEPGYIIQSFSTSLSFAYTAIGKIDGFINIYTHPWDMCAASFLIQQSGGMITALDGSPWKITTKNAVAASSLSVHKKLLNACK